MEKGHVLKFVIKGRTFDENVGIKTFPQQTYGVSEESPQWFTQSYTLQGDNGYTYRYENKPEFYYASQKKSFNIHKGVEQENFASLHLKLMQNSMTFHRKKGRLSEFMDKNGWMSPVIPIMGFERTPQARELCNRDRQIKIKSLNKKKVYQQHNQKPKVNQQYYNTISTLMSEKLKIRKERNKMNEGQRVRIKVLPKQKQQVDPIQIQNVSEKMAKTSLDFYSTSSTFYKRNEMSRQDSRKSKNSIASPQKWSFRSTSYREQSPSKSKRESLSPMKIPKIIDQIDREDQNLEEWARRSSAGKWTYRPKLPDSDEEL